MSQKFQDIRSFTLPHRQRGQALVYGIFVLLAGLASLFFMFNTGQLATEKSKLVNTADAVAYSAGVMHARALNFNAYTNRAMMANEVLVAQTVSITSWIHYAQGHVNAVPPFLCLTYYSLPIGLVLLKYEPLCVVLAYPAGAAAVNYAKTGIDYAGKATVIAAEAAKANLQLAQNTMFVTLLAERHGILQAVADANYKNDGTVKVDPAGLTDNLLLFEGSPFISLYTGNNRTRFKQAEVNAANRDPFVASRAWSDSTFGFPCIAAPAGVGNVSRTGGTTLQGFNEWRATDRASLTHRKWKWSWNPGCKHVATYGLGSATVRASTSGSAALPYSGVPNFYDLSAKALAYTPANGDPAKRDPRLKFAIRLTRSNTQARTSMGTSQIKPSGRLDRFKGEELKDVMAAVSTSEVFFERMSARADGRTELASLFNPYWQVHLIPNSTVDINAARAIQLIP